MRVALNFGIDNRVRVQLSTEPVPRNIGDTQAIKNSERVYSQRAELQLWMSRLQLLDNKRSRDDYTSDRLEIYDADTGQLSVVYRREVLQQIARLSSLVGSGGRVPFGLSPRQDFTYVEALLALDLLNESQHASKKPRFGHQHKITRLTSKAKNSLREAGCVLDNYYKDKVYLLTCTLPSDGWKQFDVLARYSGYMINRIQQQFRRIPGAQYYYVWEFQRRGALHLHYAIAHDNPEVAHRLARLARTMFYRVLRDLGTQHNIDMFASKSAPGGTWSNKPKYWQWSIDKVLKSVTGYLSKYLSKGSSPGFSSNFYPARWWGCCQSIRAVYVKHRVSYSYSGIPNSIARQFYYHLCAFFGQFDASLSTYLCVINRLQSIDGVSVPHEIEFMSIEGADFYFSYDNWLTVKDDLSQYFSSTDAFHNQLFEIWHYNNNCQLN